MDSSGASLAILAGGQGTRLGGVPKGLLRVQGRSCVDRLLELRPLFEDAFLVGPPEVSRLVQAVRRIPDEVQARGAPGGIHAALRASVTPWVVAVAWDMPFVTEPVIRALLEARDEAFDAVCFEVAGRREPLLAAYRASAAPTWEAALESHPSLLEVQERLRLRVLAEAQLRAVDPEVRAVVSLNEPDDLARWAVEMPRT